MCTFDQVYNTTFKTGQRDTLSETCTDVTKPTLRSSTAEIINQNSFSTLDWLETYTVTHTPLPRFKQPGHFTSGAKGRVRSRIV